MAQYTLIENSNGTPVGQRTFPISQATRERLARTTGITARPATAVHISSTAFDHAVATMRVQA